MEVWSSTAEGANEPQNTRPLALFLAQESKELLSEFIPLVESEVKTVEVSAGESKRCKVCEMHNEHD